MHDSLSTEEALRRLEAAVALLEEALDRRLDRTTALGDLESELHRLGADRSRLAQSLDAAEARSARLADVNAEVSRGLVEAMESIRDVLARQGA
jgi:chromosome segregation ATPase